MEIDNFYQPEEDPVDNFRNGDNIWYRDPDMGISSGFYTIIERIVDDGDNSVYMLSNGRFNLEAYQTDLSYG